MSDEDPVRLKDQRAASPELVRALRALGTTSDAARLERVAQKLGATLAEAQPPMAATSGGLLGAKALIVGLVAAGVAALTWYGSIARTPAPERHAPAPPPTAAAEPVPPPAAAAEPVPPPTAAVEAVRPPTATIEAASPPTAAAEAASPPAQPAAPAPVPAPARQSSRHASSRARTTGAGATAASAEQRANNAPSPSAAPRANSASGAPGANSASGAPRANSASVAPRANSASGAPASGAAVAPAPALQGSDDAPREPSAAQAPGPGPSEAALLFGARKAVASQPSAALRLLDQHAARFPEGLLAPEREVLRIEALRRLGRTAEAEQRLRAFQARYPDSIHLRRLQTPESEEH